jgi:NAD(P)-dependent dehydrogenase (short-subunit alcohol dehydrogenase family)
MPTILITGANRGIGLELCRQYAARGDDVIGVCRSSNKELEDLGVRVISGIDVADGATMNRLRDSLADRRIDVLINNAGVLRSESLGEIDYDDMLFQYQVNTPGPLRVTEALLENLGEGSKVAIVTSRVGSIADNSSGGNYGYRASKTAVNMIGTNLMHDLRPRGIAVVLLHPGYVRTDMTRGQGLTTAPESAAGLIARIDELTMENTGIFWHAEGYELPW